MKHRPAMFHLGIAGLVVWYLTSGAQGPWINTWLGHSRLGLDLIENSAIRMVHLKNWAN